MPRVGAAQPGAKTQAAARKVAESDRPKGPTDQDNSPMSDGEGARAAERSRRVIAENKEEYDPADDAANIEADEAQQKPVKKAAPKARSSSGPSTGTTRTTTATPPRTGSPTGTTEPDLTLSGLDDESDFMVLVLYGPTGTRKTTSALRITKAIPKGNVLVIAAESGLKKQALVQHDVDVARVRYWPPRGQQVSFEGLEALFFKILADLERDPASWAGVVWDSLTEVIQTLVDNAAAADVARLQKIAAASKNQMQVRKTYEREGADYQIVTGQFRQLLRKYRSLPCHQVLVCLEEDRKESVETEEGRKQKVGITGPSLTPKVREDMEQHADVVIRMTVADLDGVGPVGLGRTSPAEDLRAKDRYHVLPTVMFDPGWERVWAYVVGEIKLESDDAQQAIMAKTLDVAPVTESPGEREARAKAERAERVAARRAAKEATSPIGTAPKDRAPRSSGKVTAESGTPDNPPM